MSSNSATKPASAPALGDGEHLLRPAATKMIAVEASTGTGAGLIDRGTLLRGKKGTAGAMGHRGVDFQCI